MVTEPCASVVGVVFGSAGCASEGAMEANVLRCVA
tara:strand:+ start:282 stop:386 length:105 start_codon:yes stop_codon:yes gene_type:complete